MPEQDPVRMQGPFRRASGARGVNEQRWVIGSGNHGGERVRRVGEETLVVQNALGVGAVDTEHMAQFRKPVAHAEHAVEALGVRHHYLGPGVTQPVVQCFRSEQG